MLEYLNISREVEEYKLKSRHPELEKCYSSDLMYRIKDFSKRNSCKILSDRFPPASIIYYFIWNYFFKFDLSVDDASIIFVHFLITIFPRRDIFSRFHIIMMVPDEDDFELLANRIQTRKNGIDDTLDEHYIEIQTEFFKIWAHYFHIQEVIMKTDFKENTEFLNSEIRKRQRKSNFTVDEQGRVRAFKIICDLDEKIKQQLDWDLLRFNNFDLLLETVINDETMDRFNVSSFLRDDLVKAMYENIVEKYY